MGFLILDAYTQHRMIKNIILLHTVTQQHHHIKGLWIRRWNYDLDILTSVFF